ncbi:hypothetical protein [Tepidanaerobacter syntrophicus]|uniref:Uncharacterized protein n=1 Tax=Tepidanaerobacter syntrophicus TaxID=224999 RepID=A0A0U9HCN8_9FIRM|nr:hypothetical protein [Tepidanaerobacter syntrophicus]GAQ24246.1 hypothetical protein TSYNT_572 [Tepidanaerobacter syntrophicus]
MSFIRVLSQNYINGLKNIHCCNAGPYGSCCKHMGGWQEGGGWSERSFIFCDYLKTEIYMEPPIPKPDEDFVISMPEKCPMRYPTGQINIIDLMQERK